jgi:hypothetical protein
MSHNKYKVGTATVNRDGELNIELSDLSNVTTSSKIEGSPIRSLSSTWTAVASVSAEYATDGYAAGWSTKTGGSSSAYTSTGALNSYRTHTGANWEDTSSNTQITFGGLDLDRGTEGGSIPTATRFSRIILDEGKYFLIGQTMVRGSSSSAYIELQWQDTDTSAVLGPRWRQYGAAAMRIGRGYGYVEVGAGTTRTVDMRVVATSGTMYDNPHNSRDDLIMAIQVQ